MMSQAGKWVRKSKGEHCLNVFVSKELKGRLKLLAQKYDRPTADIVRAVLKIGIPLFEGLTRAEESVIKENVKFFQQLRRVKSLKEI